MGHLVYTAAQFAVGADLMSLGEAGTFKTSQVARKIKSIAVVGSTAVADCALQLFVGQKLIGSYRNTTAGASKVPIDVDKKFVNEVVPAGIPISMVVSVAANTQIVVVELDIGDAPAGRAWAPRAGARRAWVPRAQWLAERRAGLR